MDVFSTALLDKKTSPNLLGWFCDFIVELVKCFLAVLKQKSSKNGHILDEGSSYKDS